VTTTEQRTTRSRRQGYDLLRIISICGVVAIHTFGRIAINPDIQGSATSWAARFLSTGFVWVVPVFVMLSGALSLTERAHQEGPRTFYAKRAKRIIPALIAWNFIYLVLIRMLLLDQHLSGWQIVTALFDTSVYPQLYFLWLIAGLYAVAPLLAAFIGGGGLRRALVLAGTTLGATLIVMMTPGVLALGHVSRPIQLDALTFWLAYVGYFISGYALSRLTPTVKWVVATCIGVVVLGVGTVLEGAYQSHLAVLWAFSPVDYLGTIVALLSICVFVAGTYLLDRLRLGQRLGRLVVTLSDASFGVFLVHLVILLIPYDLLTGFQAQRSLGEAILAYAFILVVSFLVSMGAKRVPGIRLIF
jgi:surface polysaccharide O-acyltransferase-like enzyme